MPLFNPASVGGGGTTIEVQEETISLSTAITTLNFTGLGATADVLGSVATIDIPGGGGGGVSDGDKGDITVANAGALWTVNVGAVTKDDVGLGNVDNTADTAKPVSTAQQTALDLKAVINNPTFTGTTLTLANAQDLVINSTTGTKIGQAGSKIGFFGVTPVVIPTALVQTYSTASSTHSAVTQLAAPAGGVGAAAGGWSTAANRDLAITSINAARTDIANLKNFVNALVDRLQSLGLLQ